MSQHLIFISLGFVCSWLLLLVLIPRLRFKLLDHPNSRSSHSQPTPRAGGLAFVSVTCVCSVISLLVGTSSSVNLLPLFCLPLAIAGFLDDFYNLSSLLRYVFQLFTAFLIAFSSPVFGAIELSNEYSYFSTPLLFFFLLICVTAVINFTNFMDGLDGLVAGCMAVAISSVALHLSVSWSIWFLVGSLIGFLMWNWCPAKVFMGDVGSTFLGAVFAGLVLHAPSSLDAICFLLFAAPLFADASICVFRRFSAGHNVFKAHRLHLFQRLHQAGWSHARVSLIYIACTALLPLAKMLGGIPLLLSLVIAEIVLGFWLDRRFALPFSLASQS